MNIRIYKNRDELGKKAASDAAGIIENTIRSNGSATIVVATGTSQFELLKYLVEMPGVDWSKVVLYHLDEYIGISEDHPASFVRYIKERIIDRVSPMKEVHLINGKSRKYRWILDKNDVRPVFEKKGQGAHCLRDIFQGGNHGALIFKIVDQMEIHPKFISQ